MKTQDLEERVRVLENTKKVIVVEVKIDGHWTCYAVAENESVANNIVKKILNGGEYKKDDIYLTSYLLHSENTVKYI